ncbi:hypothetical protein ACWAUC_30435 [Bradyrhizobium guangdongense]
MLTTCEAARACSIGKPLANRAALARSMEAAGAPDALEGRDLGTQGIDRPPADVVPGDVEMASHGGSIQLKPSDEGVVFELQFPVA